MLFNLRRNAWKRWFDFRCARILATPPIRSRGDDGLLIVTEVGNRDLAMYLVAIKSLHHRLGRGRIAVLVDDDLPKRGLDLLKQHVDPAEIAVVQEIRSPHCPKGGTWERLLYIASQVERNFVIQVDADTVTFGDIEEVIDHVQANRSFMLSEWRDQEFVTMAQASDKVREFPSDHVQMIGERSFRHLPNCHQKRYARGQSSFAGFARGSFSVAVLEEFSSAMRGLVGEDRWREWGSESLASNVMVSNAPQAALLPCPKYTSYYPERGWDLSRSSFLHFEGTNRFRNGLYIRKANSVIGELSGLPDKGVDLPTR